MSEVKLGRLALAKWKAMAGTRLRWVRSRVLREADSSAPQHEPANLFSHNPCVLVVDDNPGSRWDVSELLVQWGIQPQLAADGAEAVALARERDFALILMDLQMPVLNGLAATQQIRRHEQERSYVRAPVVAYTTRAVDLDDPLLRDSGVDAVLAKPCDAMTLRACLVRWCALTVSGRWTPAFRDPVANWQDDY